MFKSLGLEKTSVKFTFVTTKVVAKCTERHRICVLICGGTLAIGLLFVRGIIVVNGLQDPTNFRCVLSFFLLSLHRTKSLIFCSDIGELTLEKSASNAQSAASDSCEVTTFRST